MVARFPPTFQITKLEEVYGLKKYVPQITVLDLSDNPLCEDKSYRCVVVWRVALCTAPFWRGASTHHTLVVTGSVCPHTTAS